MWILFFSLILLFLSPFIQVAGGFAWRMGADTVGKIIIAIAAVIWLVSFILQLFIVIDFSACFESLSFVVNKDMGTAIGGNPLFLFAVEIVLFLSSIFVSAAIASN